MQPDRLPPTRTLAAHLAQSPALIACLQADRRVEIEVAGTR
jgi:hypothetical protein